MEGRAVSNPVVNAASTKSTTRSVSMPLLPAAIIDDDSADDSHQTMLIHDTPSPPSSPESVLFIQNSAALSRSFLRHDQQDHTPSDEGWVTWGSPPKPIPALHGPLSLPYARCPSGAEGTIIEEPSVIPTVIWGLDHPNSHHDPSFQHQKVSHSSAKDKKSVRKTRNNRERESLPEQFLPTAQPLSLGTPFDHQPSPASFAPTLDQWQDCFYDHSSTYSRSPLEDDVVFMNLRREALQKMDQKPPPRIASSQETAHLLSLLTEAARNSDIANHRQRPSISPSQLLPTPPNSTAPLYSSTFSPLRVPEQHRDLGYTSNSPACLAPSAFDSPSSAELSEQLRKLVLGPIREQADASSPSRSAIGSIHVSVLQPSPQVHTPVASSKRNKRVLVESTTLPNVAGTQSKSKASPRTAPRSPGDQVRSSLSNPRSVPITRLQNARRLNLPTVPEEPEGSVQNVTCRTRRNVETSKSKTTINGRPRSPELTHGTLVLQSKLEHAQFAGDAPELKVCLPKKADKVSPPENAVVPLADISLLTLDSCTDKDDAKFLTPVVPAAPVFAQLPTPGADE